MKKYIKNTVLATAVAASMAATAWGGHYWYTTGRYMESTDDAYLKADYTLVAPKISGYVAEVRVRDNQAVKAGDVLVRIDPRDFQAAVDKADASVALAENSVSNLDARIGQQQFAVNQATANVRASEAALDLARQDLTRYQNLLKTNYIAAQQAQHAETAVREKTALLDRDRAAVEDARQQIQVLRTERAKAVSELAQNRAAQEQARLDLEHTLIRSPINGTVGARTVRVGKYVQAGTELMAVVPLQQVYVIANFKETQIGQVQGNDKVSLEVDTFPGVKLHGHVDSVSPASGLEFALLPPDNATGNFTKIVQRVPVKIVLDRDSGLFGRLRPGMSVVATIDTRNQGHVSQAAAPAAGREVAQLGPEIN